MDSAPYFKYNFIVWWVAEIVSKSRFKKVILLFMVLGHTNFAPDVIFAEIAHSFYKLDMFTRRNLLDMALSSNIMAKELDLNKIRR